MYEREVSATIPGTDNTRTIRGDSASNCKEARKERNKMKGKKEGMRKILYRKLD